MTRLDDVIEERGGDYGHPLDHHTRTAALIHVAFGGLIIECDEGFILPKCEGPRPIQCAEDWQLAMVCDKVARLAESPRFDDSWLDIGGYAKTRDMTQEERKRRASFKPPFAIVPTWVRVPSEER